jgi:predicted Zn-ribbon and HTH transcriptional regulator
MPIKYSTDKHLVSCTCNNCGATWRPRDPVKIPLQCPRCHLPRKYWLPEKEAKP